MVEAYDRSIAEKADTLASELLQEYQRIALDEGVIKVDYVIEFGSPKLIIPKEIAKKTQSRFNHLRCYRYECSRTFLYRKCL